MRVSVTPPSPVLVKPGSSTVPLPSNGVPTGLTSVSSRTLVIPSGPLARIAMSKAAIEPGTTLARLDDVDAPGRCARRR